MSNELDYKKDPEGAFTQEVEEHIEEVRKAAEALEQVAREEDALEEKIYAHEQPRPDNVVAHPARAMQDLPVTDILRGAADADLVELVVCGVRSDGREFLATSMASIPDALYNLERAKRRLHAIMDERQYELTPDNEPPEVA